MVKKLINIAFAGMIGLGSLLTCNSFKYNPIPHTHIVGKIIKKIITKNDYGIITSYGLHIKNRRREAITWLKNCNDNFMKNIKEGDIVEVVCRYDNTWGTCVSDTCQIYKYKHLDKKLFNLSGE